jgi:hypothetical protein
VDVRKEQDYAKSFDEVLRVLSQRFKIARSSAPEGVVETEWSTDWPKPGQRKYRVPSVVAFETDRRALDLRVEAEYGKSGKVTPGRDVQLEELVAGDLEAALQPQVEKVEPPPPPPASRLLGPTEEGEPAVDVRLSVGIPFLRGIVKSDDPNSPDSTIRFGEDGGMDRGTRLGIELSVQPAKGFMLALGYSRALWSGSDTMDNDERFDGVLFPAGSSVDAEMTVDRIDLTPKYVYDPGVGGFVEGQFRLSYLSERLELEGAAGTGEDGYRLFLLNPRVRGGPRFEGGVFLVGEIGYMLGYPALTYGAEVGLGGGVRLGAMDLEVGYRASFLDAFRGDHEDLRIIVKEPYLSLLFRF